jgi:DNA helicase HerA-like ATPase
MRKIIIGAQVSMDGVMQAPGGPTEDPTKGFKFGGWVMPYVDQEFGEEVDRVFKEKFDLLLGRKTYEIFAAYWPYYEEDAPHGGIAKLFKDIQTIVLDNEGEFASLREAVDVLLVGASGELPANPRHAALLARRLLEFKVSAVVDLYDLKLAARRRFVKLFLESLIHLPRDFWRPTLVILDEAHIYCPERGSGEAESTEAVVSLMSQGRKRG